MEILLNIFFQRQLKGAFDDWICYGQCEIWQGAINYYVLFCSCYRNLLARYVTLPTLRREWGRHIGEWCIGNLARETNPLRVKTSQCTLASDTCIWMPHPSSVSINRQQVQCIFRFLLRSRAGDPAAQRWHSNCGNRTWHLHSILHGTRVTSVTETFPFSCHFDVTSDSLPKCHWYCPLQCPV